MGGIGVIIVTYGSGEVIGACLDACLSAAAVSSVVVVDNGSTDDTLAEVARRPRAQLIANGENRGFAGAVNQGVASLPESTLLVLNPDAVVETGLEQMAAAIRRPGVGACGGLLATEDGKPQSGFCVRAFPSAGTLACEVLGINRLWPGNPVNRRYRCQDLDLSRAGEVDQPAGAFLMFRREAWERTGGFDEAFWPVWFEDVDFCLRVRRLGYTIWFAPEARARHSGAHSIRNIPWGARQLYWYDSLLRYAAKHYPPSQRRGVALAVALAALPRAFAGLVDRREARPLSVYSRVILFALRQLFGAKMLAESAFEVKEPVSGRVTRVSTQDHFDGL